MRAQLQRLPNPPDPIGVTQKRPFAVLLNKGFAVENIRYVDCPGLLPRLFFGCSTEVRRR